MIKSSWLLCISRKYSINTILHIPYSIQIICCIEDCGNHLKAIKLVWFSVTFMLSQAFKAFSRPGLPYRVTWCIKLGNYSTWSPIRGYSRLQRWGPFYFALSETLQSNATPGESLPHTVWAIHRSLHDKW